MLQAGKQHRGRFPGGLRGVSRGLSYAKATSYDLAKAVPETLFQNVLPGERPLRA